MNKGVIYVIVNNINQKKYVGQAVSYCSNGRKWGSFKRWKAHVKNANNDTCECRLLESAIKKYGEENFIVKDILECDISELNQYEDDYITLKKSIL